MHGKLGSLYMSMGTKAEMEKGKAHLNQALEIAGNKLSENDHTAAEVMATMGQLLLTEGQYEQVRLHTNRPIRCLRGQLCSRLLSFHAGGEVP